MSDAGPRIAVVGAGITGLVAAHALARGGADVVVYDAAPRPGGVIATTLDDGHLFEAGPISVAATPALWALVRELGLEGEVVRAAPLGRRRYLVHRGRPVPVPGSPAALLRTPLLSLAGKCRALLEPFASPALVGRDESVAARARRRLGPEVLARIVAPLVTGIYAGDAERLSVRHAMPALAALERAYGSLLVGAVRALRRRGRRAPPAADAPPTGSISFRRGLATLPAALAGALGDRMACGTAVRGLAPGPDGRWRVAHERRTGGRLVAGATDVDAVVLAVPAHALAGLAVPRALREALAPIAAVDHAPVATLALAFRRADVAHPLDGFGMLVPPVEGATLRGVVFTSSAFPHAAPSDAVLLTCFVGGVLAPADAAADTAALLPRVLAELRTLLGVRGMPRLVRHSVQPGGIPQYAVGHGAVLAAAGRIEEEHPGLVLAGSWRGGVAVGACVAGGRAAAVRAARHAARSPVRPADGVDERPAASLASAVG
ncbi:MAG: protoporphyrinogen oxidase [Gemmatirosa sp.]